jgi:RsiW-degrading membrane proteinase PrsW (M82 family)
MVTTFRCEQVITFHTVDPFNLTKIGVNKKSVKILIVSIFVLPRLALTFFFYEDSVNKKSVKILIVSLCFPSSFFAV